MAKIELTQEVVKSLFDYKDGFLFYKSNPLVPVDFHFKRAAIKSGKYFTVKILDEKYHLHRIIFLWHHGYVPPQIDHSDRNSLNNRIENLRAATYWQNNANRTSKNNSTSKYRGVYFDGTRTSFKKWGACIYVNGELLFRKFFNSENEAALAYNKLAVKHHKEFANLNILSK